MKDFSDETSDQQSELGGDGLSLDGDGIDGQSFGGDSGRGDLRIGKEDE